MIAMLTPVIIVLGVVLLIFLWAVSAYNRLVDLRNQIKNAFAQIDVQLKRRYDLIPNLVETAKAYMKHERETLEAVIAARNQAVGANAKAAANPGDVQALQGLMAAEGMLNNSLGKLFALAEAYPELQANQNMLQLTEEISSTENRIAFTRQAYNDGVMVYNIKREQFPTSIVAALCSFQMHDMLQSTESPQERIPPKVTF